MWSRSEGPSSSKPSAPAPARPPPRLQLHPLAAPVRPPPWLQLHPLPEKFLPLARNLQRMEMSVRAATSFCLLMYEAQRNPADADVPAAVLQSFQLNGEDNTALSCWRIPLRGMERPDRPAGGCSEVSSLRLFCGPQRDLLCNLLLGGKLIGESPQMPGILGKGFLDNGWNVADETSKAVKAVNAAGCEGIIFEAVAKEMTYKRQRTNEGGQDGVVRDVTPEFFTRTNSGGHFCAHPDSLLIEAVIIRDDFLYPTRL